MDGPENSGTAHEKLSKEDSPDSLKISIKHISPSKNIPDNTAGTNARSAATTTVSSAITSTATTIGKPEFPPPPKGYGGQWEWDAKISDYVRLGKDGKQLLYSNYQKKPEPETPQPKTPPTSPTKTDIPKPLVAWQGKLDDRFQVVAKPKRFFSVGRIFKVVWFEPRGQDTPVRRSGSGPDWASECPAFYGEQAVAKFRWFVIARRRLHHSLCFSITTYSKAAPNKTRGRDMDYVVLHSSAVEPAAPYPEENIKRDPIAVIIEDGETFISPIARLDCGRIYTVEDNLRIMKVGRVHPASLELLDQCYRDSVE
ncbi:hypothetical protein QBC35DRAFT_381311 [Podospora australis]|uniref:DUF6590 domain-containing protein n=1 Tax=Podospora australis TaxID=1536484 RepID=A0AAN6WWK6_9PEZI|nr:hypothetical protein QBC35DRAFT_381311 [Podospora australis]